MNARSLVVIASLLVLVTGPARAGLDFGSLNQALSKAKEVTDTAKEASKVAKGVAGIGPEEEKIIGDSVALEVVGKFGGLVRDEEITHRINLVGRALARYSSRPELSWRFGVLDSDTVNAFSAPDGYVFITRGLYELAKSDDQLAGVLGHEIAHITRKHALNVVRRDEFMSGGKSLLGKYSGDYRAASSTVSQVDAQLQQFDVGVGKITTALLEKGFDQPTEFTADKDGHDLAALTGYAPGGLRSVLVQLQEQGAAPGRIFSTHPPLKDRLKHLPADPATP